MTNIERLRSDKPFEAFALSYPELKRIISNLYLLGKAYESKQMLSKELMGIENSIVKQNKQNKQSKKNDNLSITQDQQHSTPDETLGQDDNIGQDERNE